MKWKENNLTKLRFQYVREEKNDKEKKKVLSIIQNHFAIANI